MRLVTRVSALVSTLLLASCVTAKGAHTGHQTDAAPSVAAAAPAGSSVTFPAKEGAASGYLALPGGQGKHPAIIVIQEWWGLNDWIRQNADRFASQGYVALAVDLYRGRSTSDPSEAHELMRGMPEDRAIADLRAAFDYLAGRPDVDASRIGAIGWCMGGGYSLALATVEPRLAADVINYGRLVTDADTIARIRGPLLGNFGADDRGIPADDVRKFDAALRARGVRSDIKIYEGAGHGFMNPGNTQGYAEAAAADAWKRIDEFLAAALRPR